MTAPDDVVPGLTPDEHLAMDYALGALGRSERRDAERRLRSDPQFLQLVIGWQNTLAPLADEVSPVEPPAATWDAIAHELTPALRAPSGSTLAAVPARRSLWNSLVLWRGLALTGALAAVVALAVVGQSPSAPGAPPRILVASLAGEDGKPFLSAAYDATRGAVVITPAAKDGDAPASGRDIELWVIEGDKPPRSLGIIDIDGAKAYAISSQRLKGLQPGATLAISVEPQGGSPTGQPTGPVIATGKLSAI